MRLVAIGLVAGLFSALFGVGGGIVMVPLLLLAHWQERPAMATSLAAIGIIALDEFHSVCPVFCIMGERQAEMLCIPLGEGFRIIGINKNAADAVDADTRFCFAHCFCLRVFTGYGGGSGIFTGDRCSSSCRTISYIDS